MHNMNDIKTCKFCGMLNDYHRTLDCKGMTLEGALKTASLYMESYNSIKNRRFAENKRLKGEIEKWHGKFLMVKQENNKLRNVLYKKHKMKTLSEVLNLDNDSFTNYLKEVESVEKENIEAMESRANAAISQEKR